MGSSPAPTKESRSYDQSIPLVPGLVGKTAIAIANHTKGARVWRYFQRILPSFCVNSSVAPSIRINESNRYAPFPSAINAPLPNAIDIPSAISKKDWGFRRLGLVCQDPLRPQGVKLMKKR